MHLQSLFLAILVSFSLAAQTNQTQVPNRVEQMPEFPGKYEALTKFLNDNMKYPAEEKAKGIEGIVGVKFIVNSDGTISDITVPRKLTPACDEEAVRLVKMFPKFIPGKQGGKPTRVYTAVAVKFVLAK